MPINRRRAPSSDISSKKKLGGHQQEQIYADLIHGEVLRGTQKGDVKDRNGNLHSVKSGKKWQVFLYTYSRISRSHSLKILKPCQEAFPENSEQYFKDRIKCIAYKENFIKSHGRDAARNLSNDDVIKHLGVNTYIESKIELQKTIKSVCNVLEDKKRLREFLNEALFNNEVAFMSIKDDDEGGGVFRVFTSEYVLDTLSNRLFPVASNAGRVPEDFNVAGQKTLLRYQKNQKYKNIVEIEIRNDSKSKYRLVRFNMYSKDALFLLMDGAKKLPVKFMNKEVVFYGQAIGSFLYNLKLQ